MESNTSNLTTDKRIGQLRSLIEGFAARHAALNIQNGASPDSMMDCFDALYNAARQNNLDAIHTSDWALHQSIIKLANVPGLEQIWNIIANLHESFSLKTLQTCWPDQESVSEAHRYVVDAICSADPTHAENAALEHHEAVWYRLEELENIQSTQNSHLQHACAYIVLHPWDSVSLDFIAKKICHISPGHLARLFTTYLGVSFTTYLRQFRMRKALSMLSRTKIPINQIAEQVGYKDASRFTAHFRRFYGKTPSEVRGHHLSIQHHNSILTDGL